MDIQPTGNVWGNPSERAPFSGTSNSRVTPNHVENRPANRGASPSSLVEQLGGRSIRQANDEMGHLSQLAQDLMVAAETMITDTYLGSSALIKYLVDHWSFIDSLRTDGELRAQVEQCSESAHSRPGLEAKKAHTALIYVLLRAIHGNFSALTGNHARMSAMVMNKMGDAIEEEIRGPVSAAAFIVAYTSLPGLKHLPLIGQLTTAEGQRETLIHAFALVDVAFRDLQSDPEWNALLESISVDLPSASIADVTSHTSASASYPTSPSDMRRNNFESTIRQNLERMNHLNPDTQFFMARVEGMILEEFSRDPMLATYCDGHWKFIRELREDPEFREKIEQGSKLSPGVSTESARMQTALKYVMWRIIHHGVLAGLDKAELERNERLLNELTRIAGEANLEVTRCAVLIKECTSMPGFEHVPAIGQLKGTSRNLQITRTLR